MEFGDWEKEFDNGELEIGDWAQSPNPNPQTSLEKISFFKNNKNKTKINLYQK